MSKNYQNEENIVNIEDPAEKERKAMLDWFYQEAAKEPFRHVTKKSLMSCYHVTSAKAKLMLKIYKNNRNLIKYNAKYQEKAEEMSVLTALSKSRAGLSKAKVKRLKDVVKELKSIEKDIGKSTYYLQKRQNELNKADKITEASITANEEDRIKNVRINSLREENVRLHNELDQISKHIREAEKNSSRNIFSRMVRWIKLDRLTRKQNNCKSKLFENEWDLSFYTKESRLEEEREKNMIVPGNNGKQDDVNIGNEGDMNYRSFTGNGMTARHHSEIFDGKKVTKEEAEFKQYVLGRVNEHLDKKIDKLNNQLETQEKEVLHGIVEDNLKKIRTEGDYERTKSDLLDAINVDKEYKRVTDNVVRMSKERKQDKKRLEQIYGKLSDVIDRAVSKTKKKEKYLRKHSLWKESSAIYLKKYELRKRRFDRLDKKIQLGLKGVNSRASFTEEEYEQWCKLRSEVKECYDRWVKECKSTKELEKNIAEMSQDIMSYQAEIKQLEEEQSGIENRAQEEKNKLLAEEKRQKELYKLVKANKKKIIDYDELMKYDAEKSQLQEEKADFERQKQNAEEDVRQSEISKVLLNNASQDTVDGIYINNMLYINEDKAKKQGIKLYNNKNELNISAREALRQREIQKIVKALKSRPIFKFLNSDTLSEYMTYDQLTGEFQLAKEGLTPEQKKAYDLKMRSMLFDDDSVFSNRKVEGGEKAIKAFGEIMLHCLIALVKEGYPEGLGALGADQMGAALNESNEFVDEYNSVQGMGRDDDDRFRRLLYGIGNANGTLRSIIDSPLNTGTFIHTDCCAALKDINSNFFLKNAGYNMSNFGVFSYVLGVIQSGARIGIAKEDINKQTAEMQAMLRRNHNRFARVMKSAKTESEVELMKGIVSTVFSTARTAFMMTSGVTGFVTDLGAIFGKIIVKAIFSKVMRGKSNREILDSPEVLGGIDYNKDLISEDDFNDVLAAVTGIKSKDDLTEAMHIIDSVDLHRAALKSQKENKADLEVDRSMYALGFGDRHRYDKVKVEDILNKTAGGKGSWQKRLRNTIEYKGVDYDTSGTRFKKDLHGINYYADKGHKSRNALEFEAGKEYRKKNKGEKVFESKKTKNNRIKEIACMNGAKRLYECFVKIENEDYLKKLEKDSNFKMNSTTNFILNPENRDSILDKLSKEEAVEIFVLDAGTELMDRIVHDKAKEIFEKMPSIPHGKEGAFAADKQPVEEKGENIQELDELDLV